MLDDDSPDLGQHADEKPLKTIGAQEYTASPDITATGHESTIVDLLNRPGMLTGVLVH